MLQLLIGAALALLTYDRSWGAGTVGLIPHFIGFGLILFGAKSMEKHSSYFERIFLPTYVMVVYSLAYYLIKAFGLLARIEDWNHYVVYMMDLAEAAGTLMVCYLVVLALSNVEHKKRLQIGCKGLQTCFRIMASSYILYYISYMTNLVMENYATTIISLVLRGLESLGIIVFLFAFYRVWGAYTEHMAKR